MASNYAKRTGTKGLGSGVITNDDAYILDIEEAVDDSDKDISEVMDERAY